MTNNDSEFYETVGTKVKSNICGRGSRNSASPSNQPDIFGSLQEAMEGLAIRNSIEDSLENKNPRAWAMHDDVYWQAPKTVKKLPSGLYEFITLPNIGISIKQKPFNTDELIIPPDDVIPKILEEFNLFWTKKQEFVDRGLLYKRGLILYGPPGGGKCHTRGTPILMFDGSIKAVETIKVGDLLMGPDSKPRTVLSTARGIDNLYEVIPVKGTPYGVNEAHILSLQHCSTNKIENISVKDYLNESKEFKLRTKGWRTGVEFFSQTIHEILPPYLLGIWLGDGTGRTKSRFSITQLDNEIVDYIKQFCKCYNLGLRKDQPKNKCPIWTITDRGRGIRNRLVDLLRQFGLYYNKYIPNIYKINSRKSRLELLAGLIDSDGELHNNCYYITQKSETLANDIVFLARSLGFAAYISPTYKVCKTGNGGTYWQVYISGDISVIPVLIKHKIGHKRKQIKNVLHTGISIKYIGVGDYFGFELDKDGLYLLGDFTVTHNTCTLSLLTKTLIKDYNGIVIDGDDPDLIAAGLAMVRKIEPTRPIILMLEDLDSLIERHGETDFLSLLDGEDQIDNIITVACPDPKTLILKADLTWQEAGNLSKGDSIISFDENGPDRKYRTALINSCPIIHKPKYKVITTEGEIIVSEDHPFLIKLGNRPLEWRKVQHLNKNNKISFIGTPWSKDISYGAGYIAGQLDGEGSANISVSNNKHGFKITWTQTLNNTVDIMQALISERGYSFKRYDRSEVGICKDGMTRYKPRTDIKISGGRWENIKFLGSIRPHRLIIQPNLSEAWENCRLATNYAKVLAVEYIGLGPVVALDTTTNTFIGNGFLQHNTTNYPSRLDKRLVNRPSRFDKVIKVGMPNDGTRRLYLQAKEKSLNGEELDRWVKLSKDFSLAHLKEMIVAVKCLNQPLDEVVERLKQMRTPPKDSDDNYSIGFNSKD